MSVKETPNTVTVGHVCLSCALLATGQCPYGNHKKAKVTEFKGDIRGKCTHYINIGEVAWPTASGEDRMTKEAQVIEDAKLNVSLFKKISNLNDRQRQHLFSYWDYIFPSEYASDMVDEEVKTQQDSLKPKPKVKKDKDKKEKKNDDDKHKKKENAG